MGSVNASQLHSWVLKNLTPIELASTTRQGELIGSDAPEREFWEEAGRHQGLCEASGLLLDLIAEMQADERLQNETKWASEEAEDWARSSLRRLTDALGPVMDLWACDHMPRLNQEFDPECARCKSMRPLREAYAAVGGVV